MIATNNPQPALRQASTSLNNAIQGNKTGTDSLGKEDFLNLLMAQVTNQDPLNPMDSQGMMDQLTSMGSLEQLVNLNKGVAELNNTQGEIARTSAYAFLDRDVTVRGGNARVTAGTTGELRFDLARPAETVNVFITDSTGNPVRTLSLGAVGPGSHHIPWDAQNGKGEQVADGTYRYSVVAKSQEGESLPVEMLTRGRVSGVSFQDGHPVMIMDGERIDPRDIVEISNVSQRLFGQREPRPLQEEMVPKPPAEPKPE